MRPDNVVMTAIGELKAAAPLGAIRGGASQAEITEAELALGIRFPASYAEFLSSVGTCNWPDYVYGLGPGGVRGQSVVYVTIQEREEALPHLPAALVAFAPDGYGNHYCLDTSRWYGDECPVVFWDHDGGADQQPRLVEASFGQWLLALVREATG